jgi:signal peptidase II
VTTSPARKYVLFTVFAALSLGLDQWTKVLARQVLRPLLMLDGAAQRSRVVVPGFFDLHYSENEGVAFGFLQHVPGGRYLLTAGAVLALILVIVYLRRLDAGAARLQVALGLVGGGALGNVIDRVSYGRVTDFIVWHVKAHQWPTFNVADAALCIGVGLVMLDMFKSPPPEPTSTSTSSA